MRAVLDPNVIISALLSPSSSPARVILNWQQGSFELIVSPMVLAELERVLAYPKLRKRIPEAEAERVLDWFRRSATVADDPDIDPPVRSPDPGDDYLVALATSERAALVSGDGHLLGLAEDLPIFSPRAFLEFLDRELK